MAVLRILLAVLLLGAYPALAVIETYQFSDPVLEERYQLLSEELRCPKCQNQNIADSNALISQDLRKLLYQQLESGASDQEILDYMVARYGEFVRYRPRFGGATTALWLAPILLLVLGIVAVFLMLRPRKRNAPGPIELNTQEQQRLQELMNKADRKS